MQHCVETQTDKVLPLSGVYNAQKVWLKLHGDENGATARMDLFPFRRTFELRNFIT
jgi:hypothetical protein